MVNCIKKTKPQTLLIPLLILTAASFIVYSEFIFRLTVSWSLFTCLMLGLKQKKMINPFCLFAITPLSLLLYMNLGGLYMLELSDRTWKLAIININAFILTLYFVPSFKMYSNCVGLKSNKSLVISAICFYVFSFIGGFFPQLDSLFWFLSVAAIVCAMKTRMTIMYVFCAFIVLSSMLSGYASKMGVLLNCVTVLICYDKYLSISKHHRKRLVLFCLLGIGLMIFAFSFANKDRGKSDANVDMNYFTTQGNIDWNYNASLFMPYMYLVTPWTNLEYVIQTQDKRTNGLWLIKPILGYIGVADDFKEDYELIPYSSFNTFTFIPNGFKDFGFFGSVIMSIFLGWFVKKIYTRYEVSKSPFDITSYILVALATAEMFFSNHFLQQSYPFTCFIIMEMWKIFTGGYGASRVEIEKDVTNNRIK